MEGRNQRFIQKKETKKASKSDPKREVNKVRH